MAAALLQHELDDGYCVTSAGINALVGQGADPLAIKLMAERQFDLSTHVGRQVDERDIINAELIYAMDNAQLRWLESNWSKIRGRAFLLGHWSGFEIPDPYRHGEAAFRRALLLIERGVREWREKLGLVV